MTLEEPVYVFPIPSLYPDAGCKDVPIGEEFAWELTPILSILGVCELNVELFVLKSGVGRWTWLPEAMTWIVVLCVVACKLPLILLWGSCVLDSRRLSDVSPWVVTVEDPTRLFVATDWGSIGKLEIGATGSWI